MTKETLEYCEKDRDSLQAEGLARELPLPKFSSMTIYYNSSSVSRGSNSCDLSVIMHQGRAMNKHAERYLSFPFEQSYGCN